jgi:hypothetical protein
VVVVKLPLRLRLSLSLSLRRKRRKRRTWKASLSLTKRLETGAGGDFRSVQSNLICLSTSLFLKKGIGKGKRLDNGNVIEPDVKAGDRVLFSKYGGTEVKVDGQDYLIMREDDILGVL